MNPVPLWRVFPRDPDAAEGERFSAAFVPGGQGRYRFDLPGNPLGVIHLAEIEAHAVAETIQACRNASQPLTHADLTAWGHRHAPVSVSVAAGLRRGSAFRGEWRTAVHCRDRIPGDAIAYSVPRPHYGSARSAGEAGVRRSYTGLSAYE